MNKCIEASKQTDVSENTIRNWIEDNLITTIGTRGIGGISNKVLDILENKYLIRKLFRSGVLWYKLTHDRLVKPIRDSNREWHYREKKANRKPFYKHLPFKS